MTKRVFIITGEHSGDLHASFVVKELKKQLSDVEIVAVGGQCLKEQGVRLFHDHTNMSVGGFGFVKKLPAHIKLGKDIINYLNTEFHPDLVLLIDYGGFNLTIAEPLKKNNYKVLYYIAPQIWATRKHRLKKISKYIDKMMLILPFEEEIHKNAGVNAEYVGHPLVSQMPEAITKEKLCEKYNLNPDKPIIGLFPGSRKMEIQHILDIFIKSALLINKECSNIQFCLAQAENISDDFFNKYFEKSIKGKDIDVKVIKGANYEVLSGADALILASGTVTLEAGIYKTPMVLSYKAPWFAYQVYLMIRYIDRIGLPNIILNKDVVPEFIQERAKPELIADYLLKLIDDTPEKQKMISELKNLNDVLTDSVASKKVADNIVSELTDIK